MHMYPQAHTLTYSFRCRHAHTPTHTHSHTTQYTDSLPHTHRLSTEHRGGCLELRQDLVHCSPERGGRRLCSSCPWRPRRQRTGQRLSYPSRAGRCHPGRLAWATTTYISGAALSSLASPAVPGAPLGLTHFKGWTQPPHVHTLVGAGGTAGEGERGWEGETLISRGIRQSKQKELQLTALFQKIIVFSPRGQGFGGQESSTP